MKKDPASWIGWGGFFAALVGALMLPEPYSRWAERAWFTWITICIAYACSINSRKPFLELLKNAVIASVILGGLAMLFYGQPSIDADGQVIDEGFPTTFDSQAGAGVKVFLKILAGSLLGIYFAGIFRKEPPD